MRTSKCGFSDRVRFNWGFHDACFDVEQGGIGGKGARITHSDKQDLRHVSPSFDKAYHAGYEFGLEYKRMHLGTSSSRCAWLEHNGKAAFERTAA